MIPVGTFFCNFPAAPHRYFFHDSYFSGRTSCCKIFLLLSIATKLVARKPWLRAAENINLLVLDELLLYEADFLVNLLIRPSTILSTIFSGFPSAKCLPEELPFHARWRHRYGAGRFACG